MSTPTMPDAARRYVRLTENLSKVLGWFAVAMICASILLVVQMVVYRYALGLSTSWQTEVIIFLIVAATFIGSPYVLQQRGHINVDILATLLNERGRRRLELLGGVLSLLFCVAMAYYSALWWYDTLERGRTHPYYGPDSPMDPLPVVAARNAHVVTAICSQSARAVFQRS